MIDFTAGEGVEDTTVVAEGGYALPAVRRFGPPLLRSGLVDRRHVIADLPAPAPAVTLICAPAGYGKTTLTAQWAADDGRPFVWLDVTRAHADPVIFLADVIAALEEIEPLADPDLPRLLVGDGSILSTRLIPRLGRCLRMMDARFVLVVDDVDTLTEPLSLEALQVIATSLPEAGHLVLAGRRTPALRLAAMRMDGRLRELGPADLAMGPVEADLLLAGLGLGVDADELEMMLEVTEGWPAGLALTRLAIQGEPDGRAALRRFAGGDRRIADYFAEEVLTRVPPQQMRLLRRTSVLDTLTPAACSAVMARDVTLEELGALHRMSSFVVPLDQRGERFRLHRLLAEVMRHELRRCEPEIVPALHARAGAWHAGQGDVLAAVGHLREGGHDDAAAELVWRSLPALQPTGRIETLRQMLSCFSPEEIRARAPLALAMAWTCADRGSHMVAHWTRHAAAADFEGPLPGGPETLDAGIALLHATIATDGAEQIGRDARRAYDLDGEASPWRSVACLMMGIAAYLTGDEAEARRRLAEGGDRAGGALPSVYMLCRTSLGVMDLLAGDRAGARLHAARAQEQVEAAGLQEYSSVALLESLRALQAAQASETDRARALSRHARMLMGHNADIAPWIGAIGRVLLARAALLTGDEDAARTLIQEAAEHRRRLPDASVLRTEIESTQRTIDGLPPGAARGSGTLTTAELRVLQYLPTHLTFREIGERLHLSRFTIKSQSLAVYRKLGANSRSEAVARARGLGLLADDRPPAGPEPGAERPGAPPPA